MLITMKNLTQTLRTASKDWQSPVSFAVRGGVLPGGKSFTARLRSLLCSGRYISEMPLFSSLLCASLRFATAFISVVSSSAYSFSPFRLWPASKAAGSSSCAMEAEAGGGGDEGNLL